MAYDSKISFNPPYWKATIRIPLDYLPKNVVKLNAATRHGSGHKRSMDVLYVDDEPLPSYFTRYTATFILLIPLPLPLYKCSFGMSFPFDVFVSLKEKTRERMIIIVDEANEIYY